MLVTFGDAELASVASPFRHAKSLGCAEVFCTRNCLGFEAFKIIEPICQEQGGGGCDWAC